MSEKIRVAVVYGGRSSEHSVSCISAGAIMKHLDPAKYTVVPIGITKDGQWTPGTMEGLEIVDGVLPEVTMGDELALSLNPETKGRFHNVTQHSHFAEVDVIIPVLHGPYGEDGTVQGLFELSDIPYVGAGVLASSAGMDKEFTKKLLTAEGLPVAPEVILKGRTELSADEKAQLGLPVFVKPARGGSSIGVSKVTDWAEFSRAVEVAFESDNKVLVEPEIVGAEVEIGVLEYADGSVIASVPAQLNGIEEAEEGFYDFDAKYIDEGVSAQIPAPLDPDLIQTLRETAVSAFRALGCEGLSRVDFFVTKGAFYINEINTFPGFTPISMYPKVLAATGVDYAALLDALIEGAMARA
ncbi:D-alanine--D-alanine ligase family protein [Corynebacterium striatum]|uniref:D-alanine--D-alanine ligase family protein n=1 Tax=Corynebacterium striatum TaxID=43770 RepID=UPI00254D10A9|nr:D-alanine--D-alanine ligase family protein [Corynebacterium striatum]MDK8811879.1 D-alanine--D-alanine ligase family protein [Corynebacterium striatum]